MTKKVALGKLKQNIPKLERAAGHNNENEYSNRLMKEQSHLISNIVFPQFHR